MENSELGGRWLREQGAILAKKSGPVGAGLGLEAGRKSGDGSRRSGDSDRSSMMSEQGGEEGGQYGEMPVGGLELERDSNGR